MTNQQVFSAFAAGCSANGGSVRSVVQSNGVAVLYSYATPIAYQAAHNFGTDPDTPVFDERKYSVTTSRQQSQAKSACGAWTEVEHGIFREQCAALGIYTGSAR